MNAWSSIPLGTVPQRARAPGPPHDPPAPAAPTAPSPPLRSSPKSARVPPPPTPAPVPVSVGPASPSTSALDAPTTAVEEDPTNRLSAHLLTGRAARPAPSPTRVGPTVPPWPTHVGPGVPTPADLPVPAPSSGHSPLPFLALAALLALDAAVLAPWPGSGPWVGSSPVGLALLAGVALLVAPVTIDLLVGRDRATAMLVGLPLMAAAAAGTILVTGGDLAAVLAAQGLDADTTMAAGMVAVALLICLVVGAVGVARRPRPAAAVGASAVVVGVCAAVSAAAVVAVVVAIGGPDPQTAAVATAAGATPTAAVATSGGASPCPAEAASTLPEAATGAPVIAHDSRVHVAICQGVSGALYYYGADDRTHLTITLPATRSEDSWIATNNGVTYYVTPDNLEIMKAGTMLAEEALTPGWAR
jgi:hypothetical protein